MNTIEKHEGKIWALDINAKQQIITGGNDGLFCFWNDNTQEQENQQKQENYDYLLSQQKFANFYFNKQYDLAAKISFEKNMIKSFIQAIDQLFNQTNFKDPILFEQILKTQQYQETNQQFISLINSLVTLNLDRLLIYLRDMNSTISQYRYSQKILEILFRNINLNDFAAFYQKQKSEKFQPESKVSNNYDKLLDILLLYTQRHQQRIWKFIKNIYSLDQILNKHNILTE
eukprot:TRINITY_DN8336_c0_g1_i2.p2 TRINITY_DN8336_c0_g1~~TRINITY_DN8336_c0_g1_i2.p2  ORF type:complete len:230 (-),score=37.72 TRINITY_DN8336_c0_g1_i2:17-706(-)